MNAKEVFKNKEDYERIKLECKNWRGKIVKLIPRDFRELYTTAISKGERV